GQAQPAGDAGRLFHDLEPRRHRRHRLHADHQRAGSGDSRSIPLRPAPGVPRRSTRAAADPAVLPVLRSPCDRWSDGRALHDVSGRNPGRSAWPARGRAVSRVDLVIPDLGNFADILVTDVLITPGDQVELDTPLVTLETDKASMDVPATAAGTVAEVLLKRGDKVSKGSIIARVDTSRQGEPQAASSAAVDPDELERTVRQPVLQSSSMDHLASEHEQAGEAAPSAGQPATSAG